MTTIIGEGGRGIQNKLVGRGYLRAQVRLKLELLGSAEVRRFHRRVGIQAVFPRIVSQSFLSQDDGELGFAGFGRVVEGGAFAIALGGAEEEALFRCVWEADEAGFAIRVGSDLEVELVEVHESVSDVDADVGGVNGLTGIIGDDEIGGAGAEAGVNFRDGFGIGLGSGRLGGQGRQRDSKNREDDKRGESRSNLA